MCFSAAASFVTAGVTGAIGIAALTRTQHPRELALAATPLLFAAQQAVEGLQWLDLPAAPDGPGSNGLTLLYLVFADVLWPIYAPLMVWLIEPSAWRRRFMLFWLAVGIGVAAFFLWWIFARPHGALILDGHIAYVPDYKHSDAVSLAYLGATCVPLVLSSRRTVVALGTIILVGAAVAYLFYWETFTSIWCFFSAAASAVVLGHFERARRQRRREFGLQSG